MLRLTLLKIKGYFALFLFLALTRNSAGYDRKEIEEIVESAKKGDAKAFESLYKIYSDHIYRYLYYMLGNRDMAYDLTSQVFLKAYENLKSYRFKGYSFSAWLYKIAHNLAMDHFRSLKRRVPEVEASNITEVTTKAVEQSFEDIVIDRVTIENALRKLTEKQRQVIILKYIEQMNNFQVAEILGKTTGAVKALERRALGDLKNIFLKQRAYDSEKEEVYATK